MAGKKDTSQKGQPGKSTGGKARRLINKAQESLTNKQIGGKTNRSPNTISQIDRGSIKNPPASLLKKLKKIKK